MVERERIQDSTLNNPFTAASIIQRCLSSNYTTYFHATFTMLQKNIIQLKFQVICPRLQNIVELCLQQKNVSEGDTVCCKY